MFLPYALSGERRGRRLRGEREKKREGMGNLSLSPVPSHSRCLPEEGRRGTGGGALNGGKKKEKGKGGFFFH